MSPELEEAIRKRRDWLEMSGIPADSFTEEEILLGCVRQINSLAGLMLMRPLPVLIATETGGDMGLPVHDGGVAIIRAATDYIYQKGFLRAARRLHGLPVEE